MSSDDDADEGVTLADGRYDAFVVWAEARDDGVVFDLTITTGINKGEVVSVVGPLARDPIDVVGLPCTLVVSNGAPRVQLDA
jgi:hypothetical protein